ncbi:hypothetical protein SEVIR_8G096801v4 [Setaria viridis]
MCKMNSIQLHQRHHLQWLQGQGLNIKAEKQAWRDKQRSEPSYTGRKGQTKEVYRQPNTTSVKITKHVQIKRRHGSKASSDVWDHFTPHETEDGPIVVCNYCHQVYTCDQSFHGTSTLRRHVMNICTSSPFGTQKSEER